MGDYFILIILSGSAINIVIVIYVVKQYVAYLREKNEYLYKLKIEEIKEKERKQLINFISSELHDNISQTVSLAIMSSGTLKDDKNATSIINIQNLLNKTLTDLRYLIKTIKLRENSDFDLDQQIQELIDILNQSTDIKFSKIGSAPLLDNERKYLLLRIIQELLNNILKYSKAQVVQLGFENHNNAAFLRIVHDGVKFQPSDKDYHKGYGLNNIIENTKMLNGALHFEIENYNMQLKFPISQEDSKNKSKT